MTGARALIRSLLKIVPKETEMVRTELLFLTLAVCFVFPGTSVQADDEFQEQAQTALVVLRPIQVETEKLLHAGEWQAANRMLLEVFPDSTRTSAQAFVLGNLLFSIDPETSRQLHQRVARELPENPSVQLEWGMHQHRGKEYEGAAASYEVFLKQSTDSASMHGLQAECLIRMGKVKEAVNAWQRSEQAQNGTLEDFETLVCEINGGFCPLRERAQLRLKAATGDLEAAASLILLDCSFQKDWWNSPMERKYLENDLKLLRSVIFEDVSDLNEIVCAGDCMLVPPEDKDRVREVLTGSGFLFDKQHTLPKRSQLVSLMLNVVDSRKLLSPKEIMDRWKKPILARAKEAMDADLFNVIAHFHIGSDELQHIQQTAWDATGDVRFASGLLFALSFEEDFHVDDPRLIKALKQFPEDSQIADALVRCTARAGQPLNEALIHAIKAEYTKFSIGGVLQLRPSARKLRSYFIALAKLIDNP